MAARVLLVDDEANLREMLAILLRRSGYAVTTAEDVATGERAVAENEPFDAVITDLLMPDGSGMQILEAALARDPSTQVLMITAFATTEQAVEAMRAGAYDYVQKPFKNSELLATLEKALEKHDIVRENQALRVKARGGRVVDDLIGTSAAMEKVRQLVRRAAQAPTSVLITGESGTGKELVARALHFSGTRSEGPFVVVNCGALPESLMESELFGHEKGAFTGASTRRDGLFQAADGGTLFLDEIGELPLQLQVKLLRVLQSRRVRRVGGQEEIPVDVRVLAATNREVEKEVEEGRFREDLFYRLDVIRIHVPPLRERPEDIELLAETFLAQLNHTYGRKLVLSAEAHRYLATRSYPGNVRQLENLIERAAALTAGSTIEAGDLGEPEAASDQAGALPVPGPGFDLDGYLADVEKRLLLRALDQADGVRTRAAKLVGMSFRQFRYRLSKHGADPDADE